jgi:hypothetical protein
MIVASQFAEACFPPHLAPSIMLEPAGFDQENWTSSRSDSGLWTLQLADAFGNGE